MNYPKEIRNKAIVILRKLDPETYKYKILGELMPAKKGSQYKPMHPSTVEEIYKRDMDKYDLLPTSKAFKQADKEMARFNKQKGKKNNFLELKENNA